MGTLHVPSLAQGRLSLRRLHSRDSPCCRIKVHFKDSKGGLIKTVEANEGDDILSIAHEHDIDLEGKSPSPLLSALALSVTQRFPP